MPKNRALLVGINSYQWKPLQFAVQDAQSMAQKLSESPYNYETTTLVDSQATRKRILDDLTQLLASSHEGTHLLFLAGHAGMPGLDRLPRFVSYGAEHFSEMVGFREISEIIQSTMRSDASLIVILDCCHAGAFEIDNSIRHDELKKAVAETVARPNTAALLAATLGSGAREKADVGHGVFTFHLLNGLSGAASDDNGLITLSSLYHYCAVQMESFSYQKPVLKADLSGTFRLGSSIDWATSQSAEMQRFVSAVEELERKYDDVTAKLAELRPPFLSREEVRIFGWLESTKVIRPLADKRLKIEQRHPALCRKSYPWSTLSSDVLSCVRSVSRPSIGTMTELGIVRREIGEGGFGTVFEVQSDSGVSYAYKVLHASDVGNRAKEERFRIGYRAMDQLRHRGIVSVHRSLESPPSFFMDFIDGPNLRKHHTSPLEPMELTLIMMEVAEAVEYAHSRGVIHRDIKPENVVLRWEGERWRPVLTDFDLAWFNTATSHTIEAFGAPFYAAPEQLAEPGKDITHQETVDVYSLAMLLMFLVLLRDPVEVSASIEDASRTWARFGHSVSERFRELLLSAGAKAPAHRMKTVAEFRRSLLHIRAEIAGVNDEDSELDEERFIGSLISTIDRDVERQPDCLKFSSNSERSSGTLARDSKGAWVLKLRKRDHVTLAESTARYAKNALSRRVSEAINEFVRSAGTNGTRVSSRVSGGSVVLTVSIDRMTRRSGQFVVELLSEAFAIMDQF